MLLDPTAAYLNSGSFGPLPREVFDHVTELRRRLSEQPTDFQLRRLPALLWEARESLARFVGADPAHLILTTNATAAVNLVASSLSLNGPGEILLTDHEYETMRWCWERAARRMGLTVRTFVLPALPDGPEEIVEAAKAAMNADTRLFFFSHVMSPTGLIMPARALCREARSRGIPTVVDGAQAPGFIDLNLADLTCDFYAASGHKWLLAPPGTGFLYAGGGNARWLRPPQVSWGDKYPEGADLDSRDRFGSTPRLRRLECEGTRDLCPWLALPATIGFQASLGPAAIQARMRRLAALVRRRLTGLRGLVEATPDRHDLCGGMVAFRLPARTDVTALRQGLWDRFRVEVAVFERPDGALIRASAHFFNTESDVDRLADAVEALVRN